MWHRVIDIEYDVKGKKTEGTMKFKSLRNGKMGLVRHYFHGHFLKLTRKFKTEIWDLQLKDGTVIHLLDHTKADPMPQPAPN